MSYDYDWCGHVDAGTTRTCGAPIERWSREWRHRGRELDADHPAQAMGPVGPVEEGLHLRADRYATALATAAAADGRIAALTELVRVHEWARSQAESTLQLVEEDPQFGTVWTATGPEPEDVHALLCLTTGHVYLRRTGVGIFGWRRAEQQHTSSATYYEWPIQDAGPFIGWRDGYGFDRVIKQAAELQREHDALHRVMYGEKGYHGPEGGFGRPVLTEALARIRMAQFERTHEANRRAQAAGQQLEQLRRQISYLQPDDTQQWPEWGGADGVRSVDVIDLQRVLDLLNRADCGGQA